MRFCEKRVLKTKINLDFFATVLALRAITVGTLGGARFASVDNAESIFFLFYRHFYGLRIDFQDSY